MFGVLSMHSCTQINIQRDGEKGIRRNIHKKYEYMHTYTCTHIHTRAMGEGRKQGEGGKEKEAERKK